MPLKLRSLSRPQDDGALYALLSMTQPCEAGAFSLASVGIGSSCLRQLRRPHQIAIALARCTTALVDGPHHQALAAPAVTGREHALEVSGEFAVLRLDVAACI